MSTAWHLTRLLCTFRCIQREYTEAGFHFLSCEQHKVTFLFPPKFLSKKSQLCPLEVHWVAAECKVLTCWMSHMLEIGISYGNRGWTASLGYDLAPQFLYVFQWWSKSPEKISGRKHQRITTDGGKTLSKKLIKERKRAQKVCSLLYWSWLFCFQSRVLSWFFYCNICGCTQARSTY